MIVYRLTLSDYASDLSGTGAAMFGGRWNSIGNFLLYTAQTSSLSILEHLVHIAGADPVQYILTTLEVKNDIKKLETEQLTENWQKNEPFTQKVGDEWIKSKDSTVLSVPSVINPLENNILINPNHPNLELSVVNQDWYIYDSRLIKATKS